MKLKSLMLVAMSLLVFAIVACAQSVVFPTPLPTATPAPTATPIVFPTPLPTATPFALPSPVPTATPAMVVFPTPLPTATPFSLPSPVPTATPAVVVFPTPLPTATPVVFPTPLPTSTPVSTFSGIDDVDAVPLRGTTGGSYGVGFEFASNAEWCEINRCILTPSHVVGYRERHGHNVEIDGILHSPFVLKSAREPDMAVVWGAPVDRPGFTQFILAPSTADVRSGDPVRIVAIDFLRDEGMPVQPVQVVLDAVVSRVDVDSGKFWVTAPIVFPGNAGGVVLNANMEVVGMIIEQIYESKGDVRNVRPLRGVAIDIDTIRSTLCEWEFLEAAQCRR